MLLGMVVAATQSWCRSSGRGNLSGNFNPQLSHLLATPSLESFVLLYEHRRRMDTSEGGTTSLSCKDWRNLNERGIRSSLSFLLSEYSNSSE